MMNSPTAAPHSAVRWSARLSRRSLHRFIRHRFRSRPVSVLPARLANYKGGCGPVRAAGTIRPHTGGDRLHDLPQTGSAVSGLPERHEWSAGPPESSCSIRCLPVLSAARPRLPGRSRPRICSAHPNAWVAGSAVVPTPSRVCSYPRPHSAVLPGTSSQPSAGTSSRSQQWSAYDSQSATRDTTASGMAAVPWWRRLKPPRLVGRGDPLWVRA